MTGMLVERDPVVVAPRRARAPGVGADLPAHWPLSFTLLGFPLWWAMGLSTLIPMAMALVMADQLLRKRRLVLPGGFTLWLLFIAWLLLGVFVLFADAPGAEPGGGAARLLVFGYRVAWYLTATVALRLDRQPARVRAADAGGSTSCSAYMFVVTTVGGLVGVLMPHLEFTSPVEMLLPHGLRSNGLVESIVHPAVADIQNVLGPARRRGRRRRSRSPTRGAATFSLYLPFFLVAWFRYGQPLAAVRRAGGAAGRRRPDRLLAQPRAVGLAGPRRRRVRAPAAAQGPGGPGRSPRSLLLVAVIIAFVLSPLGTVFQERLAHQHSNERRGELISRTVSSAVEGSPVVGLRQHPRRAGRASPRSPVRDTPDCQACGVPPLGTQGHLWGVIFSQGLRRGRPVPLAFFVLALARSWRCRTTTETLCTFVLAFFCPAALRLRHPRHAAADGDDRDRRWSPANRLAADAATDVRSAGPALPDWRGGRSCSSSCSSAPPWRDAALASRAGRSTSHPGVDPAGAAAGLPLRDRSGDGRGQPAGRRRPSTPRRRCSISRQSLSRVVGSRDTAALNELRERVRITAAPNTSVLTHRGPRPRRGDGRTARRGRWRSPTWSRVGPTSPTVATRRSSCCASSSPSSAAPGSASPAAAQQAPTRETASRQAVTNVLLTPTTAGRVIRTREPVRMRRSARDRRSPPAPPSDSRSVPC